MIERYRVSYVANFLSDQRKLDTWALIETELLSWLVNDGKAPSGSTKIAAGVPVPTPGAVGARERFTGHDFEAFLQLWTEQMRPEVARWVHYGLTSSDVEDSAQGLILSDLTGYLTKLANRAGARIAERAQQLDGLTRVGRTHGIQAQLTTVDARMYELADAFTRAERRLVDTISLTRRVRLGGPVGSYAVLPRAAEVWVATSLGATCAGGGSQVRFRDYLADWAHACVTAVGVCEAFALWLRQGAQTEIGELYEPRSVAAETYTGSSSMPHKRNPTRSERVCGLARLARGYYVPIVEGMGLWGERDISHSSVERVAVADLAHLTAYCLLEVAKIAAGLEVDEQAARYHAISGFPHNISAELQALLTRHGHSRAEARGVTVNLIAALTAQKDRGVDLNVAEFKVADKSAPDVALSEELAALLTRYTGG